jgi:hypothetical protein
MVKLPMAAVGACLEALGQTLREVQRVTGQGVDGMVSRLFHTLSRAQADEVDSMMNLQASALPQADAVPGPGTDTSLPPPADGSAPGRIRKGPAPWFQAPLVPSGENASSGREGVTRQLEKAAVLTLFSGDNPALPDSAVFAPENHDLLVGVDLSKDLRQFDVAMKSHVSATEPWATNRLGQVLGRLQARFRPAPEGFEAVPGRELPPTALDMSRSQRFVLLDGEFRWDDRTHSGITACGTGRTFPAREGGRSILRLGAVIHLLKGRGRLEGFQGWGVLVGVLVPPNLIRCGFVLRLPDPAGKLLSGSELTPVQYTADPPDPGAVYLTLRGEVDPDNPRLLIGASNGRMLGAHMSELLRPVRVGSDLGSELKGVRSRIRAGSIVARLTYTTLFYAPGAGEYTYLEMRNILFTFFNDQGATIGTLWAAGIEGAFTAEEVPGTTVSLLWVVGFGPLGGGTGPFTGAEGIMSVNAVFSVYPNAFSTLYVLRVIDSDDKLRAGRASS